MSIVTSHPMIHPWATIVDGDDSIVVRHAHRAVVFQGSGARALLPDLIRKLDGTVSKSDLLSSYAAEHREVVESAIDRLVQHNLLIDTEGLQPATLPRPTLRAATALSEALSGTVALAEIAQRLNRTRVHLLSDLANAEQLESLLRNSGFGAVDLLSLSGIDEAAALVEEHSIVVMAPRRNTAAELTAMNDLALRSHFRWTHVLPYDGTFGSVGPLYLPGETGCYRCFQLRRRSTIETIEQQRVVDENPDSVFQAPLQEWTSHGQEFTAWGILTHLLSMETLRLDWAPSPLAGHIHTIQWMGASVEVGRHRLFRVPRCPACGPMDLGVPQPWFEDASTDRESTLESSAR